MKLDTTDCAWIFISFALTWFDYVEIVIFIVIVLIGWTTNASSIWIWTHQKGKTLFTCM